MNTLEDLAGVGKRVPLGGKEYTLKPLTVADFAEFQAEARKKLRAEAKERAADFKEAVGESSKDTLAAVSEILRVDCDINTVIEQMQTPWGMAQILFIKLNRDNPGAFDSPDDIAAAVTFHQDKITEIFGALMPGERDEFDPNGRGAAAE